MKKSIVFSLVMSVFVSLSGCGGGGDNSTGNGGQPSSGTPTTPTSPTPTTPATPAVPASVAPATSVPAPTYAATDERSKLFATLNAYRVQMGVGALAQDRLLDTAAQAHADYLKANGALLAHAEDPLKPGYTGTDPRARAMKAGVPATTWVAENIGGGGSASSCFLGLTNSVYHLQSLTSNAESIGLGFNTDCVIELGTFTGQTGLSMNSGTPVGGGQQMAANALAYSPLDGEMVDKALGGESPQPAPDIANPGHPVMVRVRADLMSDVLSVASFTLVDDSGAPVPGRILIAPNAKAASVGAAVTDSLLNPAVAFFLPLKPLGSAITYTATFSGARNSVPISKSWSFKTYP
ncbi:CAP domain-containing protein [Cupriavidus sp. CuC1]|uniref:CAP domain-containing protein n=1 Tax=Cupriavidus sp. CuC1 TaxID=3373131 RepID=UPI0037CE84CC